MGFLIFIVVLFLLMWLMVVLPQRRRQAAQKALIGGLKPGDEVLTAGGLYGDVTEVGEDEVALEIAPGVEVRVATRAIATVIPPDAYEDDDEEVGEGVAELSSADDPGEALPEGARASGEPDPR
jgi:preprotein translocase subunit YajC